MKAKPERFEHSECSFVAQQPLFTAMLADITSRWRYDSSEIDSEPLLLIKELSALASFDPTPPQENTVSFLAVCDCIKTQNSACV